MSASPTSSLAAPLCPWVGSCCKLALTGEPSSAALLVLHGWSFRRKLLPSVQGSLLTHHQDLHKYSKLSLQGPGQ